MPVNKMDQVIATTHIYKRAKDLNLKADVFAPRVFGPGTSRPHPAVVWIHGGALINGHRGFIGQRLLRYVLESGYVLVSIDYRLAPETRLPEIIQDVEDALAWIRREGPHLFAIDPARIAVAGGSAGGYLTLTCGHRVQPRPAVLAAFWGYGDLIGDWYSHPSSHKRHQTRKLSREEALRQVSGPPIADARDRQGDGGGFYQYCRQHGSWPQAVTGWSPQAQPEKFHPFMPLKNVTNDFPPTVLVHGDRDTDVPYQQSVMMAERLRAEQVAHQLLTVSGGEHGLAGGDLQQIADAYRRAFVFIDRHLRPG